MNDSCILECRDLTKRFGNKTALGGINVDIPRGRIVGLLGPNGSGKTTFLKLANGLLTPQVGYIKIAGKEPGADTKAVASYLPDAEYLPEWMNVGQLIKMFKDFYKDFDESRADTMLERLAIDRTETFKSMSKGTKEKVKLILAMSRRAQLYMLDEPIGGVDPATRDFIINTIITNYSDESSIIISTHLISDVEQILDDVIFINKGEVVLCDSVDHIREERGMSVDEYFREVFKC